MPPISPAGVRTSPPSPAGRRRSLPRRATSGVVAVLAALLTVLTIAPAAQAAGNVTVSITEGLDPAGQEIRVTGTGFDESQGIYVSVCVDNGPDELPTPCLGGPDTTGTSGSAAWISSNPPSYAEGLTTPYGPGGSFDVTLFVVATDPVYGIDCTAVVCSLITRADHTATEDRSQDTRTPLTFAAPEAQEPSTSSPSVPTPLPATVDPSTEPTTSATSVAEPSESTSLSTETPTAEAAETTSGRPGTALWIGLGVGVVGGLLVSYLIVRRRSQSSSTQKGNAP